MTEFLKITLIFFLVLAADFALWRKWREEYEDEEIFGFSLVVLFAAGIGGLAGAAAQTGKIGWGLTEWGMLLVGIAGVWWWCRRRNWNWWETLDTVTPVLAWVWATVTVLGGGSRNRAEVILAWLGLALVAVIRHSYRNWRWYISGKIGLVGLGWLGWFAVAEITVAFLTPSGIYWGGLEAGQIISAYLLAFVIVAIYLRSGRKLRDDLGWLRRNQNGKK